MAIGLYGEASFGAAQSHKYLEEMRFLFDLLAAHPFMARERSEIGIPIRMHRYQSHHIVYRIEDDDVVIVRVLHGRQDWEQIIG